MLENGYDEETQEVWVVVGVSEKTLNAAGAVTDMIEEPPVSSAGTVPEVGPDAPGSPRSEVRKGNADF